MLPFFPSRPSLSGFGLSRKPPIYPGLLGCFPFFLFSFPWGCFPFFQDFGGASFFSLPFSRSRRVLEPTRRYRAGATFAGRGPFPPQGPADANSRAARASGSNQQLIVRAVPLGAPSRPAAPTARMATSPVVRASAHTPKGRLPAHSPSRHTSPPGQRTPAPHQRPSAWRTAPSTTPVRRPRHTRLRPCPSGLATHPRHDVRPRPHHSANGQGTLLTQSLKLPKNGPNLRKYRLAERTPKISLQGATCTPRRTGRQVDLDGHGPAT
jgi:hypothetical protein